MHLLAVWLAGQYLDTAASHIGTLYNTPRNAAACAA